MERVRDNADPPARKIRSVQVTVVYALPDAVWERAVDVEAGATLRTAIERSGFALAYPGAVHEAMHVGVFGKRGSLDDTLHDGDRVEIYRALTVDPKEARRIRAEVRRRAARRP